MKQNSDGLKKWMDQMKPLLKDAKEWIMKNKKIAVPVVVAVLVVLLLCVSLLSGGKEEAAQQPTEAPQTEATPEAIPVPEVPLEENAVPSVNELMNRYFTALADGDVDTLVGLKNYISDVEKIRIEKKSNYIEKYENIVCYTKAGLTEGSYIAYVYNEAKIHDIETAVPALNTFVLYQNEDGSQYIYEGDLDKNTFAYLQELSAQDDVTNLCNTVQAKYNEAIAGDSQLAEFMEQFPLVVKDEVSKELAAQEQANAQTEEPETEEEVPSEGPKAKVTEVEATDTVNVRSSDSQEADKIGRVPTGTRLPLIEKKENGWSKVEFEGKEAFIKSEYLKDIVTVVDESATEQQTGESQSETASETANATVGANGKVTATTTVNVRASASENGERLGVIYRGEKLELVMQQADGWTKVKYKGKTAYVKSEFVE